MEPKHGDLEDDFPFPFRAFFRFQLLVSSNIFGFHVSLAAKRNTIFKQFSWLNKLKLPAFRAFRVKKKGNLSKHQHHLEWAAPVKYRRTVSNTIQMAFMGFHAILGISSHPILFPAIFRDFFKSSILQVSSRGEGRWGSHPWCLQQRHLWSKRHSCWFVRRAHLKFEHLRVFFCGGDGGKEWSMV